MNHRDTETQRRGDENARESKRIREKRQIRLATLRKSVPGDCSRDQRFYAASLRRIPRKGWDNAGMFLCFRPEGTVLSAQPEGLGTPKPKTFGPVGAVQGRASIMNGPFRAENHRIFRFPALRAGLTESALQAENAKTHFPVADQTILGIRLNECLSSFPHSLSLPSLLLFSVSLCLCGSDLR